MASEDIFCNVHVLQLLTTLILRILTEEVVAMLSVKKKDLKKKGLGNKPNASEPLEDHQIEQMWSSGAIGLQNPRSLLRLVWWNNVTHLGVRASKGQYDCQIEDFIVSEGYVEYKERQTKNRQGDEGSSTKRARKYNTKIWKTDGGERDPYRASVEYVSAIVLKVTKFLGIFS